MAAHSRLNAIAAARELQTQIETGHSLQEAAAALGFTVRHARRLLRLLDLPYSVRDLIQDGEITAAKASELFRLSADERDKLAARIQAGESPETVLAEVVQRPEPPKRRVPKPCVERVRGELYHMVSALTSDFMDDYRTRLESDLGPDHIYCRQLAAAQNAAIDVGRRLSTSAKHARAAMAIH
jgi:ParB-like chromosome segregation protein Spo0J